MQNHRHSCSWRAKHQSEGTRKITKNQDLRLQVQKLWDVKTTIIPIVVGALGTVSEELENHLKTIGISIVISCLQEAALLGTAFILRRVLDISESG